MRNLSHKKDILKSSAGFTFVETLVAISILLMAIAAPLTLVSQGLAASRIARDQIIATYLAQEMIEYARNVRDTNVLSGNDWLQGLEQCVVGTCMIDVPAATVESCGGKDATCDPLVFREDTGFYGSLSGSGGDPIETKFTRSLSIVPSEDNPEEAFLIATVSWKDGLADRTVDVEELILNWQ